MKKKVPLAGTSELTAHLPPIERFQLSLGHNFAFSDQYGALHDAAEYCKKNGNLTPPGIWQHGVFGPWEQNDPGSIMYHSPNLGKLNSFVARQDEENFLKNRGIKNCKAIGMPIVYVEKPNINRLKNTLLVVPIHTVAGLKKFASANKIKEYCQQIKSLTQHFDYTAVCLHYGDIVNSYWLKEFYKLNIDFILGGYPSDRNSNKRQAYLYSLFDYVTTNGWGSHVPYALSFGAKVSVWGRAPDIDLDTAARDIGGGGRERVMKKRSRDISEKRELFLSSMRCHPMEATTDVSLGDYLIGRPRKRKPEELRKIFSWDS